MEKYDIKATYKALYAPSAQDFSVIDVPELCYLAIDGHGDPNTSPEYADALEALYPVAYALKLESKKAFGHDFVVGPLEGLWRADDMTAFTRRDKSSWDWTMMLSQPDWISAEMVATAIDAVRMKKRMPSVDRLRFLTLVEGRSVQILHRGSYDEERPTLDRLHHEYMPAHGLTFAGDHHEIYLSDPRRTAPEKLKTVLRQPVRPT
jgi:hypothetical protein